ncbi:polyadenylate-binding protein RBP45C-like isoform X2 [Mangifera indica]|uniref:polyadenylate-binding protein RBP45C-like isoform X2 n=1 Tax=Mangifera indica TaxID=29780 RepID=UPI001CF942C6|nr:polyadenylate-binding protein RBP45C-like isoform X2 [Mangifera indica]
MRGLILATYQNNQGNKCENDPNNTTIFVGGLDPSVSDDILKSVFGQYGELLHVKIPAGKRCGFVQFANRACEEQALSMLNGTQLGGQYIRLSCGGYEAYGYAPPPQDLNMYCGGYPGYGNYQQPGAYQQPQQRGKSESRIAPHPQNPSVFALAPTVATIIPIC